MHDQLRLEIDETESLRQLWGQALDHAERALGREAVESWLRDTHPISLQQGTFTLGAPNATARAWIEKKYSRALAGILGDLATTSVAVEVTVRKSEASKSDSGKDSGRPARSRVEPPQTRPAAPASSFFQSIPLNEKYTFDNFVVGQSNRFAQAASMAVADHPGREFNPLFIYGGVGLGKTHLLQAIGHAMRARDPRARIAYVSGETFTTHFITSLREHREEEFRRTYRGIDIWLVDDIHFIADKTSTKEEFFHTFNELYLTNRQIVLCSDRPPKELRLMEDRLRTRLESGLMVEIGEPDLETRVAILQKRAELEGHEISADVLFQIAHSVPSNVRVLEAALIRMLALASLTRSAITPELALRALSAFVQAPRGAVVNVLGILKIVSEHFDVPIEEITGHRRDRQISRARQVSMYLIREMCGKSLVEIGQVFGGKAHSTVVYSCGKMEKEMASDAGLKSTVQLLRGRLARGGEAIAA